jgi:hypothetical protein
MMLGDSAQPQVFDWTLAGTMALDELPDSDLWYRDYQFTQEWLDETIKCLNDEEKRVAGEREVDKRAEICADMETG